jgi:mRNA-decapping enzyme subunit 2
MPAAASINALLTPQSDVPFSDAHTQESSSQSSVDNGEPQTPSPQYSESVVNRVNGLHIQNVDSKEPEILDPHFARLLSSLTLSANIKENQTDNKPVLSIQTDEPASRDRSTPVPVTASSSNSQPLSESVDHADWSASIPRRLSGRASDSLFTPSAAALGLPFVESNGTGSTSSIPLSPHYQFPSFSPRTINVNSPSSAFYPSLHSSAMSSSNSIASPPSSISSRRGMTSRRSSSTTDISPYLSRPIEMSGKRLKQLALLESVADESARMTPHLGKRDLPYVGHMNDMSGGQMVGGRSHFAPGPPASVPPPAVMSNDPSDLRVIYSSGLGGPIAPHSAFLPSLHATSQPTPLHDDPFQVRPRTSHSFRGGSYPPTSISMNQSQLLAMINGPRPPIQPPSSNFHPHQVQRNPIYPPSNINKTSPAAWQTPQAGQYPMRNNGVFPGAQPGVQSFPVTPASTGFDVPRAGMPSTPNNAQLLSILNGGGAGPTLLATPASNIAHR